MSWVAGVISGQTLSSSLKPAWASLRPGVGCVRRPLPCRTPAVPMSLRSVGDGLGGQPTKRRHGQNPPPFGRILISSVWLSVCTLTPLLLITCGRWFICSTWLNAMKAMSTLKPRWIRLNLLSDGRSPRSPVVGSQTTSGVAQKSVKPGSFHARLLRPP